MRFSWALMVLAGCPGGNPAMPDTPGGGDDGSQHSPGLFVAWHANPALPGVITDKITVSNAWFQLDHLQIVGDAGNDTRTTHSKFLLTWDSSTAPPQESFPSAPVGVYSRITIAVMSGSLGEDAYEIHGSWKNAAGQPRNFEIRDRKVLSIAFDCDAMLTAAGSANLGIRVDLRAALSGIDFAGLEEGDDEIELKEGPQLLDFHERMKGAFRLDD
jgi:hypothetical protein